MSAACLSDLVLSARAQKISRRAHWLSDPDLRQHSHAGLNKGEASNSVRRAVSSITRARSVTVLISKQDIPIIR